MQGRKVVPDQFPDRGFFYRSDQFNFAKIGVPAAYFKAGTDVIGKPPGLGQGAAGAFRGHGLPPAVRRAAAPTGTSRGPIEDAQLFFYLGLKVANAPRMPAWKPGDEFEAARKKALAELVGRERV